MGIEQVGNEIVALFGEVNALDDEYGVETPYYELKKYELRRGPQWATAMRCGHSVCDPAIRTINWAPGSTELYMLRCRSLDGAFSAAPAYETPTLTAPSDWGTVTTRDEHALGFTGSKSGCEVDEDDNLVFSSGQTTATYESLELNLETMERRFFTPVVAVEAADFRNRIGTRIADLQGVTIGEMIGTPAGTAIDSARIFERDLAGISLYDPQVTWKLYITVYDLAGNPGTYQEFVPGEYYGQYAQIKLTLARDVANDLTVSDATNATPIVVTTSADHGLHTGQRVRVFGVGGNTAANGTWRATYISGTSFSLDDSVGNGAYTSGGTVTVDVFASVSALKFQAASLQGSSTSTTTGRLYWNVRDYGAVGDGVTDDYAAINAALQAAKAGASGSAGGIVKVPSGIYLISQQLKVPNNVTLLGTRFISSRIEAHGTFPTSTAMVRLGEGTGSVYNCRLQDIRLDCKGITGSIGVYSNEAEEWSGVYDCEIAGFTDSGVVLNGCSVMGVDRVGILADAGGCNYGIQMVNCVGNNYIREISTNGFTGGSAVYVQSSHVDVSQIHMENYTNGVYMGNGATGSVSHIYGHTTVTNLVRVYSFGVTLHNIVGVDNGSNYTLIDDYRSISYLCSALGGINFYSQYHTNFGAVQLFTGTQTDARQLTIPDLSGADRTMMVAGVSAFSDLTGTIDAGDLGSLLIPLANGGLNADVSALTTGSLLQKGSTAYEKAGGDLLIQGYGVAYHLTLRMPALTADRRIDIPNVSAVGTGQKFVLTAADTDQEIRGTLLVEPQVKYEGQTSNFTTITSQTQTGAGTVQIPSLGGSGTHVMDLTTLAQDVTAVKTFTAAPAIKTAGSYAVSIKNTAEAAARDATIPTLGANAEFVMTVADQTVGGVKAFSGAVVLPATGSTNERAIWIEDDGGGNPVVKVYYNSSEVTIYP